MKFRKALTDEQYLEQLERFEKRRKPFGAVVFAVGLAIAIGGLGYFWHLAEGMKRMAERTAAGVPAQEHLSEAAVSLAFNSGAIMGLVIGMSGFAGALMAALGADLVWGYRSSKLLLKFYKSMAPNPSLQPTGSPSAHLPSQAPPARRG